jgi:CRISPR system Cascade subunit CasE
MHRTILRAFPAAHASGPGRVLFRLEPARPGCPPTVLVQSDKRPDWSALAAIPGYLLAAETKEVQLDLRQGQRLRFRLRANPTVKRDGKRLGLLREEDQRRWLVRKADLCGFRPLDFLTRHVVWRTSLPSGADKPAPQTHLSVDYEGVLEVTDPGRLEAAVARGIGPAKAYGLGLLSLARA